MELCLIFPYISPVLILDTEQYKYIFSKLSTSILLNIQCVVVKDISNIQCSKEITALYKTYITTYAQNDSKIH